MQLFAAISRQISGERTAVSTLPGYFFRPKKYSYSGKEAIDEIAKKLRQVVVKNPTALRLAAKMGDKTEWTAKELSERLTDEELRELLDSFSDGGEEVLLLHTELARLQLIFGIGEHNFESGEEVYAEHASDDIVSVLMQSNATTQELLDIIRRHNSPLAQGTEPSSSMPSNGLLAGSVR